MTFIGKDSNFVVVWNCSNQFYTVYKSGKMIVTEKYKFSDIKSYLE